MKNLLRKNKFLLFFLFTLTFFSEVLYSQNFSYGFKGGYNSATNSIKKDFEIKSNSGINFYAFGDYNFSDNFSLSLDEGFTQKGFYFIHQEYYPSRNIYPVNADINYFDITLSAKIKINTDKVKPFFTIGPSLGIILSTGVDNNNYPDKYSLEYLLKQLDNSSYGIKVGIGLETIFMKNINILFETKYNFDLTESYEAPSFQLGTDSWIYNGNVRSSVLEIMTGVKF